MLIRLSLLVCLFILFVYFPRVLRGYEAFLKGRVWCDYSLSLNMQVHLDGLASLPRPLGPQPVHLHHHGGGSGPRVRVWLQWVELCSQEGILHRSLPRHLCHSFGEYYWVYLVISNSIYGSLILKKIYPWNWSNPYCVLLFSIKSELFRMIWLTCDHINIFHARVGDSLPLLERFVGAFLALNLIVLLW